MKRQHNQDLKIRRCVQIFYKFRLRKVQARFSLWRFFSKFYREIREQFVKAQMDLEFELKKRQAKYEQSLFQST